MSLVNIPSSTWTALPITKAAIIRFKSGKGRVLFSQSDSTPDPDLSLASVFEEATIGEKVLIDGVKDGNTVYAYAVNGSVALSVTATESNAAPDGLYQGFRAQTVQPYTEANVKNGVQFYVRAAWPTSDPIAGGESVNLVFTTGSKPIIAKTRIVSYIGEEFQLEIFSNPVVSTPGTSLAVSNYNAVNPVATTMTVQKDAVLSSDGTPLDDEPEYYFGGTLGVFRDANSIPEGRERVLPINSTFLVKITNNDTGDARMQYFLDWYEGQPDLPLS